MYYFTYLEEGKEIKISALSEDFVNESKKLLSKARMKFDIIKEDNNNKIYKLGVVFYTSELHPPQIILFNKPLLKTSDLEVLEMIEIQPITNEVNKSIPQLELFGEKEKIDEEKTENNSFDYIMSFFQS